MHEQFQEIPDLPSNDQPNKGLTLSRVARKLSVEALKRIPPVLTQRIFPTKEASRVASSLKEKANLDTMPGEMVRENLIVVRDRVMILANRRVHPDMWLRDSMLVSEFLRNPAWDANAIRTFEKRQRENGQMPTAVGLVGSTSWHFADDESTMLYMIWSARVANESSGAFKPDPEVFEKAYGFVKSHADEGRYISPRGARRGWLDAFIYPQADVNTQNQGLYPLSLMSAERFGQKVEKGEIDRAISNYRILVGSRGYPVLSARFDHSPESSGLYPEYLGITIFGQEMLKPGLVYSALDNLPQSRWGYKILSQSAEGDYFSTQHFIGNYQQGEYQNGGIWPVWDNNIRMVGVLYGKSYLGSEDHKFRMLWLDYQEYPESIWTSDEKAGKPRAKRQLWDVAIPAQQRVMKLNYFE